jgi:translation initiation factor eIF-2B subunit epsilon
VAANTSIGDGSVVSNSVIGKGCRIGRNVTITDAFVWDGVTIQDGTTVTRSILADKVIVGKNCTVPAGCLVSFEVSIGDNIALAPETVLSRIGPGLTPVGPDEDLLGTGASGAGFVDPDLEDLDESDPARLEKSLLYSLEHLNLSTSSFSDLTSDLDADDDSDADGLLPSRPTSSDATMATRGDRVRLSSFASDDSGAASAGGGTSFHGDAVHGLLEALRHEDDSPGSDFDSAKLEFMGLRLANDASDAMVRRAVATALARRAAELLNALNEPAKAAERTFKGRRGAVKFVSEVGVGGGGSPADQVDFAVALQRALAAVRSLDPSRAGSLLTAMLQQLYSLDVLDEEAIMAWWADPRASDGTTATTIRGRCKDLIDWLANASEEDEDDDDDDDEEDE